MATQDSSNSTSAVDSSAAVSMPTDRPARLLSVLATFKQWLHLPDSGALEVTLGTYAANRLKGDPVWVFVVGTSSGGKSEIINALWSLPYIHRAATLSPAALLSGTPKKERANSAKGGLLKTIGAFGVLLMKDFTSIMTENRDERAKVFAALREIYDGSWERHLGVDGGSLLRWDGKLGILAGVTQAIDSEHSVMSSLGPRFLFFRLPRTDAELQAKRAIDKNNQVEQMRIELRDVVTAFFGDMDFEAPPFNLTDSQQEWLVALAMFVVVARSAIPRDSHDREVELIPEPEAPARFMRALAQLWAGLNLIGVEPARQKDLIRKVALDCLPPLRRLAIDHLAKKRAGFSEMLTAAGYPLKCTTFGRVLEDLECLRILDKEKVDKNVFWCIAKAWREGCKLIEIAKVPASPDCTDR